MDCQWKHLLDLIRIIGYYWKSVEDADYDLGVSQVMGVPPIIWVLDGHGLVL
jgi:hypothetical protein